MRGFEGGLGYIDAYRRMGSFVSFQHGFIGEPLVAHVAFESGILFMYQCYVCLVASFLYTEKRVSCPCHGDARLSLSPLTFCNTDSQSGHSHAMAVSFVCFSLM